MESVNKVILVGNLGRDPEVRYMPSGDAVANIALATSSKYKNKAGEMVEETEWHRVSFFGRQAEIVGEYLKKGRSVYIEGRLQTRRWDDKEGVKHTSVEVVANEMMMLGDRREHTSNAGQSSESVPMDNDLTANEDEFPF